MIINPNIEIPILNFIQSYLETYETCKIRDILHSYDYSIPVTKDEILNVISNKLRAGNLTIIDEKIPWQDSTISLITPFQFLEPLGNVAIVISKPRFRELSLGNIEQRNNLIDSTTCFKNIIGSSKKVLRICSPFMQKNVLEDDSFPELRELLIDALRRDVEIRILSRELFQERKHEVQWIVDIADSLGKSNYLKIVDYHYSAEKGNVISSTHAKMIVADYNFAYVGSAELRKNSLIANFEVGCMVEGPQVFGICEAFDFMFSHGRCWK